MKEGREVWIDAAFGLTFLVLICMLCILGTEVIRAVSLLIQGAAP